MSQAQTFLHRTELKALAQLALPILVAQLSFTAMGFIDTVMAGNYSEIDLAAIAVGSSISLPIMLFTQALLFSITAKAAPQWGAGKHSQAAFTFLSGLILGLFSSACLLGLLIAISKHLSFFDITAEIEAIASRYQFYIALSLPIIALYQAARSFIEATGKTRPIMFINVAGLLANIPLNYIFIYGKLGIPAMGGAGAGVGTLLAFSFMLVLFLSYIWMNVSCSKAVKSYCQEHFQSFTPLLKEAFSLLKLGLPIALTMLAEVSLFTVIALLIIPLGTLTIASHQIALNLSSQIFMLPYSQSVALTIRAGHLIGLSSTPKSSTSPLAVKHAIKTGLILATSLSLLSATFIVLFSTPLANIYTDNPDIIHLASGILIITAFYQIPDAIQINSSGALRAFHVVKKPLIFSLCAYWLIAMPLGYLLAYSEFIWPEPLGVKGFWIALVIGLGLNAIALSITLHKTLVKFLARA